MYELIDKVEKLKEEINKEKAVVIVRSLNKRLNKREDLMKLIDEYRVTRSEEIKNKIFSDSEYLEYKHYENEVNFIILKIMSELKKIKGGIQK